MTIIARGKKKKMKLLYYFFVKYTCVIIQRWFIQSACPYETNWHTSMHRPGLSSNMYKRFSYNSHSNPFERIGFDRGSSSVASARCYQHAAAVGLHSLGSLCCDYFNAIKAPLLLCKALISTTLIKNWIIRRWLTARWENGRLPPWLEQH